MLIVQIYVCLSADYSIVDDMGLREEENEESGSRRGGTTHGVLEEKLMLMPLDERGSFYATSATSSRNLLHVR